MFKVIKDKITIDKFNFLIRNIFFMKESDIFYKKNWLIENNYIAYPLLKEIKLSYFNDIDYYLLGITINRIDFVNLGYDKEKKIDDFWLYPENIYLLDKNINYYRDVTPLSPNIYLYISSDFDLFGIIDTDLGIEVIAGRETKLKTKLGDNYLDKLIDGKIRRFDYLRKLKSNTIIYEKKIVHYYESILKEQGYLK